MNVEAVVPIIPVPKTITIALLLWSSQEGQIGVEVSYPGYARQAVNVTPTAEGWATTGMVKFPPIPQGHPHVTATAMGLVLDDSTEMLVFPLMPTLAFIPGDVPVFDTGAISWTQVPA